jgi:hypothetical protein
VWRLRNPEKRSEKMQIIIKLDKKIDGFKGADGFTREKLVNDTLSSVFSKAADIFETIYLVVENSECDELVMDCETGDIITRLR